MKLFTKRFIGKSPKNITPSLENILYNANKAHVKLQIPEELYMELSAKFPHSILRKALDNHVTTAFFAGFVIGWAEKNDKIK